MSEVLLLDLDNTLIDNDAARERLAEATRRILGRESDEYWRVYEAVREELGYVDTLGTLERFHRERPRATREELDRAILDFPYEEVRYPAALSVLAALRSRGTAVVLSDGDPVFQPLKVARSGIGAAVAGNVLVFMHKEEHLDDVARLFPAERYVVIDDKAAVLARVKLHWAERTTTVHVLQGKYADDAFEGPRPDLVVPSIGDVPASLGSARPTSMFGERGSMR